ncbi:MAG: nucleoside permease [Niabella sp.]
MSIKFRLTILSFLQFFIWGAWLITIGAYWFQTKKWSGAEFGAIFSTMGISALFMPTLTGILADRMINAEKLLGVCHILGGAMLLLVPMVEQPATMFPVMLVNMLFYMPTISLANTVSYTVLKNQGLNVVKDFPPIRVWGTIGFIAAMWTVSLLHLEKTTGQFYVAAGASFLLAIYSFTLPQCPPPLKGKSNIEAGASMGKNVFSLFRNRKLALFFIFSMLLGAALQLTNAYGDTFLHDFAKIPAYTDTLAVKFPAIVMSVSQISETLFILAIPFFLRKFGIKKVMLISMIAWVLRFGLFAYGNPGSGFWMIILSCIIYGMAFDFFNISGSLFVETESSPKIRASAQGIFMMMTNGIGAVLGSVVSGIVIDKFFTKADGDMVWHSIWLSFAIYALVVAIFFAILFRHKHHPAEVQPVSH